MNNESVTQIIIQTILITILYALRKYVIYARSTIIESNVELSEQQQRDGVSASREEASLGSVQQCSGRRRWRVSQGSIRPAPDAGSEQV